MNFVKLINISRTRMPLVQSNLEMLSLSMIPIYQEGCGNLAEYKIPYLESMDKLGEPWLRLLVMTK